MTSSLSFESFMHNYQNMVYSLAMRLLGNDSEAQDISQEVFLKAFHRFNELQASPTAGGWLKTVTKNLRLIHITRYRNRWKLFSEMKPDQEEGEPEWDVPVEESSTAKLSDDDRRRLLECALMKLPTHQRVPLVLYHFEDMSYEDIAQEMNVSLSKVKTDIFRAREVLRKRLKMMTEWGNF